MVATAGSAGLTVEGRSRDQKAICRHHKERRGSHCRPGEVTSKRMSLVKEQGLDLLPRTHAQLAIGAKCRNGCSGLCQDVFTSVKYGWRPALCKTYHCQALPHPCTNKAGRPQTPAKLTSAEIRNPGWAQKSYNAFPPLHTLITQPLPSHITNISRSLSQNTQANQKSTGDWRDYIWTSLPFGESLAGH